MQLTYSQKIKYMAMFKEYLKEFGPNYTFEDREYIKENFFKSKAPYKDVDILRQIYCKLEMVPVEQNVYIKFANMVGQKYGWDTKILEVGGGYYPIFSKYIDDYQNQNGGGTITVMDPVLVTNKLGRVKLQKTAFNSNMDVSDFELLIGICPCEATKEIVRSAVINKKEFFIVMCGCTHFADCEIPHFYPNQLLYQSWVNDVYMIAQNQEQDGFEVNTEYADFFPYPIISSKRKK